MNFKRGLFRIWLLLAVGCWGVGGYYAYDSFKWAQAWEADDKELRLKLMRPHKTEADGTLKASEVAYDDVLARQQDEVRKHWSRAEETQETAIRVMIIPVASLIVYFIGGWVARGFSNK